MRASERVFVSLDWSDALPKQETVALEFWTNSNDQCGAMCDVQKDFIRSFVSLAEVRREGIWGADGGDERAHQAGGVSKTQTIFPSPSPLTPSSHCAQEFESKKWVTFAPHYLVWDCPVPSLSSPTCRSQCIRRGRYCAPDPDGDQWEGYTGAQVVEENLRSLCVHELARAAGQGWVWWEYATQFGEACQMSTRRYGRACAEGVFEALLRAHGGGWGSVARLRECVGDVALDAPLPLLDRQRRGEHGDAGVGEVSIVPTLRINEIGRAHV